MSDSIAKRRGRKGTLSRIDPLESPAPSPPPTSRVAELANASRAQNSFWEDIRTGRWVVRPSSSLRILLIPVILHLNWILLTPLITTNPPSSPFAPLLFISHPTPSPTDDVTDPRYRKGPLDLLFIAYYIVFWSFVRQSITIYLCQPFARRFGIYKQAKLDRFGEQGYAVIYFAFFGAWGVRVMSMLPTWWYNTSAFWTDYPHWQMIPELKAYYLVQAAYWCQQLIVMVMKLEKPRKDYNELIAHHIVTLWLVGWSYGINLTLIGNAVYTSMDIPDTFLGVSKILNYLRMERTKIVFFLIFFCIWTYFRHYLNLVMLWSVYTEFDLIPESSKRWAPLEGVWMVWWMKWQIFVPILLLQILNLFWYFLILRIAYRAVTSTEISDVRSDDESDGEEEPAEQKKKN
ncbi:longevity assurance proteins LAG1/LAC1 [Vararia minispora EC-137]|uniref:Longevity assurance proteins LAG1/LAC1 n=1 Tax=Vararia minispora EC-137 TaxID=1314806 RepID=A0ACB8QKD1_9AGAM|nr:longevity assurance proteins LAG1/LAC1 [Vararia minispora EC-137]